MSLLRHDDTQYAVLRERMVTEQLESRRIRDPRVLQAMRTVPRELFVLPQDRTLAYEDYPLPIGFGQTISQPYMVAFMAEQLSLTPDDTVLEIGTGSGYAAAVMSQLVKKVHTLEIVKELYERSSKLLKRLQYAHVVCHYRDGYQGMPELAPFDKIILTAAPEKIPETLLDQLKVGGSLVGPIGNIRMFQQLIRYDKLGPERFKETELMGVSFVEMIRDE